MSGMEEKPRKGKKPKKRKVPDIPALDTTHIDTETDRVIVVALRIPFFGKQSQAKQFIAETLPRIVAIGIGSNVEVVRANIDGKIVKVGAKVYDTTPGVKSGKPVVE